jgi:hypothetical protein
MNDFRAGCVAAKFAIKIPIVHAFWQRHASLPFDVFADFVFDGIEHTIPVLAFDV